MPKLSILIPVYNERSTIRELLVAVEAVPLIGGVTKEIIIIDDGSTDGTREILSDLNAAARYKIILQPRNGGKGASIRAGLAAATGDYVVIQDADLEYEPGDYNAMLEPMLAGAPVVYGSRELNKQRRRYSGLSFYLGGRLLSALTNLLYGTRLTDEPTCYKMFRAELIKKLPLVCRRFEFCPEVTALIARRGIMIVEVPIHYYPRGKSEGKKIGWRDGVEAIWTLIRYRFKRLN